MNAFILQNPWDLASDQRIDLGRLFERNQLPCVEISSSSAAHLLLPGEVDRVRVGHRAEYLPDMSAPFLWKGQELRHFALPCYDRKGKGDPVTFDLSVSFRLRDQSFEFRLRQKEATPRPDTSGDQVGGWEGRPGRLAGFIDWQIHSFQEILDQGKGKHALWDADIGASGLVRRSWLPAQRVWLGQGAEEEDPARMALIVKLADRRMSGRFQRALDSVALRPRRILQRYRKKTPLGRVQELDATCIRWFARQPGSSAAEKAGPRQSVLSVERREHFDTLENRVARWVLVRLRELATRYRFENARYRAASPRVQLVSQFEHHVTQILHQSELQYVTELRGGTRPNYVLQFDSRYHPIWLAYLEILRENRVEDDAWRWQRVLWRESGSQIFGAWLSGEFQKAAIADSTPYYRTEQLAGRWTEPPLCPGPFVVNDATIDIIDFLDGVPPDDCRDWMGVIGCHQLVRKRVPEPDANRFLAIWYLHDRDMRPLDRTAQDCASALGKFRSYIDVVEGKSPFISGLVFLGDPEGNEPDLALADAPSPVVLLTIPSGSHRATSNVQSGIELAVDHFLVQ